MIALLAKLNSIRRTVVGDDPIEPSSDPSLNAEW